MIEAAFRRVDNASLIAFRIAFGVLMCVSMVRLLAYGWVEQLYLEPTMHFTWWGFGWVDHLPGSWMHVHVAVLAVLAGCIAVGLFTRVSTALFGAGFVWLELIDKTTWLNHYYLIGVVAALMVLMPLGARASIDARLWPARRATTAPVLWIYVLRAQLAIVYVFAGLAKLNPDWLLEAQPMTLWLAARETTPVVGPWLVAPWVAWAMSWAGAAFDLTIVGWLCWRRTRLAAWCVVVVFHVMTWMLFNIGMFPWIMIALTTIFFAPDWPVRSWGRWSGTSRVVPPPGTGSARPLAPVSGARRALVALLAVHFAVQIALPMRPLLYPGNTLWTEEGFRFAWRVMLVEKSGSVEYRVHDPATGRRWRVSPRRWLTPLQQKAMSTQPDMILEMAHVIARDAAARGLSGVEVRADAFVSFNGRPSRRLIDPDVDLARERDGLGAKAWILGLDDPRGDRSAR